MNCKWCVLLDIVPIVALTMTFFFSLRGSNDNFRDGMFEMEIGNDIDELRNDDRVKFILQLSDSDDNSSESGFSEVSYGHVIGHSDQSSCLCYDLPKRCFVIMISLCL